ncbi:MAG: signal peptide peptidase SppA [Candidatus Zixiibacteriota bacterium]|nr:MAG: signal peptide peptidase SppA [candidate division Zixibacteria bacterium]
MRRVLFLAGILSSFLLFSSGFCHQSPTESFVLPYTSVATSDDISAVKFNPAGLGLKRGSQTGFFHTFSDSSFEGDNAWFLSLGSLGFSAEWLGNVTRDTYRKYTLAHGARFVEDWLYLGTSYSWFGSRHKEYDDLSSWKVGLLARPFEFLSIGAVAEDLNRPTFLGKRTEASFDLGAAVRPLGGLFRDRLTLSVDVSLSQKERLEEAATRFRAEAEPLDGFIVFGDIDNDGNFGIGGRVNLPRLGGGSYNSVTKDYEYNRGIVYATISHDRYRTLLRRTDNFLEIRISGKIVEENSRVGIFGKKKPTMIDLLTDLGRAKDDETIRGMLLRIDPFDMGLAKTQEIREAILDFKTGGKTVIAFLEQGGDKEYYLATAADRIALLPTGYLDLNGLAAQVTFIKGTLDKLGVVADLEHIGDYKSASDLVTRESMSPAHREVVNSILDDLYDQITRDIAQERGWTREETKSKIDQGPFTSSEALKAGLVDTLLFFDQMEGLIKSECALGFACRRYPFEPRDVRISREAYHKRRYYKYSWAIPPKVAVIFATGSIMSGQSGRELIFGDIMGSETISEAIRAAREDDRVKAVVFRVDSGGGSGIASDVILREIIQTKSKKPVVVSMSDVAGSGGYWISCAGDTIVSMPGTYTGSIGVIMGKGSLEGLYEKIGFSIETIKRGKRADFFTSTREFSEEEREVVRRQIKEFYDDFVRKVADERDMSEEDVHAVAQGRVWTGRQAEENGLVDELGGLNLALTIAKEKANLPQDAEVEIVTFPKRRLFFGPPGAAVFGSSHDLRSIMEELKEKNLFGGERVLLLMPYSIEIE